jgi:hypothetical protein
MAFVANVDVSALDSGLCFDHVAARTGKGCGFVFGMNFFLHENLQSGYCKCNLLKNSSMRECKSRDEDLVGGGVGFGRLAGIYSKEQLGYLIKFT